MSSTFVRDAFYVQPPEKTASAEEWQKWLEEDRKKAIQAKREYTRKSKEELGELPDMFSDVMTRKVNGVYKQVKAIGAVGTEDNFSLEPMVDAVQERSYDEARFVIRNRGKSHQKSGADKRKERRLRRRLKRDGLV